MKRLPAVFYHSLAGKEPVREWIRALDKADRCIVGTDIKTVEFGWPLGMPLCRSLDKGLWEIRAKLTGGRIARILFCVKDNQMMLLHAFIKKTQKTPPQDKTLALRRMKEML